MSFLQESVLGDMTRGGQLLLHFLRMIGQVIHKFGGAAIAGSVFLAIFLFLISTTSYERYVTVRYYSAAAQAGLFQRSDRATVFRTADGRWIDTTVNGLASSPALHLTARRTVMRGIELYVFAFTAVFAVVVLVVFLVYRMGFRQRQEKFVRGGRMIEGDALAGALRQAGVAGPIELAGVPLVKGIETSHILATGTSGSGKTVALHALLKDIRDRGERVICFSPSGDFIQAFYRDGTDILLNPFDVRCPSWNLWDDCPRAYDHDLVAGALVPDPVHVPDPFWNTAARTVISSLTQVMGQQGERDIARFLELLSIVPLPDLHAYLRHTEAGALVDPEAEKPALSIRSTAVTYARALKYLPIGRPDFHLREWVMNDEGDRWVFLNATDPQMAAVRPLLSMWLEILTNSLLSLPESRTRRIWLVIDELPSLHKIPSLHDFLARARKHGGCGVIAFQTIAQMRERYGKDAAEALAGLCSTWLCLRQPHHDTAKWVAQSFGDAELIEANQGLSYGANDMRDGVSLSNARRTRPLLLDSEIMTLGNLEGYLKMTGSLADDIGVPAAHVRFPYRPYEAIAPAFVASPEPVAAAPTELRADALMPAPTIATVAVGDLHQVAGESSGPVAASPAPPSTPQTPRPSRSTRRTAPRSPPRPVDSSPVPVPVPAARGVPAGPSLPLLVDATEDLHTQISRGPPDAPAESP